MVDASSRDERSILVIVHDHHYHIVHCCNDRKKKRDYLLRVTLRVIASREEESRIDFRIRNYKFTCTCEVHLVQSPVRLLKTG